MVTHAHKLSANGMHSLGSACISSRQCLNARKSASTD